MKTDFSIFNGKTLFLITIPPLRFTGRLPSHHISLTCTIPLQLNLGTHGMMTPTKSSVVLVAGSALKDLYYIQMCLYALSKHMKMFPYVVILLLRENDIVPDTEFRHAMSPPMVRLQVLQYLEITVWQVQLYVDKHGSISSTFQFICHGIVGTRKRFSRAKPMSTQLVMKRGMVATPLGDVCQGRQLWVAYNLLANFLMHEVKEGQLSLVEHEYDHTKLSKHITFPYEILNSFLHEHQLSPIFLYTNQNWGETDPETGLFTGAVGTVRGDTVLKAIHI
jgi:hypothetical protein